VGYFEDSVAPSASVDTSVASSSSSALTSSQVGPPVLEARRLRWGNHKDLESILALPSGVLREALLHLREAHLSATCCT
jgi:hypothetical protein